MPPQKKVSNILPRDQNIVRKNKIEIIDRGIRNKRDNKIKGYIEEV